MDPIQNLYTNNTVKEQVMTWAARMPAYCFTELCPDSKLRRGGNIKKNHDMDLKMRGEKEAGD